MATSLSTCFHPITIVSNNRISRIKPPAASASGKWWTPLFGWSSDPDYIHNPATATDGSATGSSDPDNGRSRFAPGCFTEEKAKQLRMKTIEMANFHDIMYHSAIASRLASDVSGHYDRCYHRALVEAMVWPADQDMFGAASSNLSTSIIN